MDCKEKLDETYRALARLNEVLSSDGMTDGTKLYWVGRVVSEVAANLRPICDPENA